MGHSNRRRRVALIVVVLVGLLAAIGWWRFTRVVPTYYASDEEHFKYGYIGVEAAAGMPYWLWLIMPRMFPEKLPGPGGYASLGMVWEEGREMPVGLTKTTIGKSVGMRIRLKRTVPA